MGRLTDLDEFLDDGYDTKSWDLGNDYDCENCGISWNEAEFDSHFHDENQWEFWYRVGCYGGDAVSWNSDNREEKLDEMFEELRTYPGWPRKGEVIVREMIEVCDEARQKTTN
jgi:hypothetical protein